MQVVTGSWRCDSLHVVPLRVLSIPVHLILLSRSGHSVDEIACVLLCCCGGFTPSRFMGSIDAQYALQTPGIACADTVWVTTAIVLSAVYIHVNLVNGSKQSAKYTVTM